MHCKVCHLWIYSGTAEKRKLQLLQLVYITNISHLQHPVFDNSPRASVTSPVRHKCTPVLEDPFYKHDTILKKISCRHRCSGPALPPSLRTSSRSFEVFWPIGAAAAGLHPGTKPRRRGSGCLCECKAEHSEWALRAGSRRWCCFHSGILCKETCRLL